MTPHIQTVHTRRDMLKLCGCGFGHLAFASLFGSLSNRALAEDENPLAAKKPHFAPRVKRVIFLFMHGGPSQVDTFDPKPLLTRDDGLDFPLPLPKGKKPSKLLKSPWEFKKHGESGADVSSLFPEVAKCVDDLCFIRSMHTDGQSHGQAVLKLHTGSDNLVRPSMGAWTVYGLGTENQNLPGFITICPTLAHGGVQNFGAAFLPAVYQGTSIGNAGVSAAKAQIRHITNAHTPETLQRRELELLQQMNHDHMKQAELDAQLEGVIASHELAFRMQTEAPKLTDISEETKPTLDLYGINENPTDSFGRQCLLARRFAERGVRFVQVSHSFKWDQHGNLKKDHERNALEVDKPIAGLLKDLKARGLLKDTLVLWGGEFGRTPTVEGKDGRDHDPHGFTMWMAGGGIRTGITLGATDDYGYYAVQDKVHMHDLHATLLHLLGVDHEKLTYRYAGRDFRLTDVHGKIVKKILL